MSPFCAPPNTCCFSLLTRHAPPPRSLLYLLQEAGGAEDDGPFFDASEDMKDEDEEDEEVRPVVRSPCRLRAISGLSEWLWEVDGGCRQGQCMAWPIRDVRACP